MQAQEVIKQIFTKVSQSIPNDAIETIIKFDIRVENYFVIHAAIVLKELLNSEEIQSFEIQSTLNLPDKKRTHLDIEFTDKSSNRVVVELKHFCISQKRTNRNLRFYTSNSKEGKKIGIIKDCEKLEDLQSKNFISKNTSLVCMAFITPKPSKKEMDNMIARFKGIEELQNWELSYPIEFNSQSDLLASILLKKKSLLTT